VLFSLLQQFPQNNINNNNNNINERYGSNLNNQYGSNNDPNSQYGINNNGYLNNFNVNDGYNNQNPYDIEYERRIRVETEKLRQLMLEIDKKHTSECTLNVAAQWNFETNVNEVSQLEAVSVNYLQIRLSFHELFLISSVRYSKNFLLTLIPYPSIMTLT
jgi:hypothetical protein